MLITMYLEIVVVIRSMVDLLILSELIKKHMRLSGKLHFNIPPSVSSVSLGNLLNACKSTFSEKGSIGKPSLPRGSTECLDKLC
jgi:hypothetical protein